MDAAERMNSLEGVGETASTPPFCKARLVKPLHGEQEKTEKDETELVMKSQGSPSSSTGSSILDKCQPDHEISFDQLPAGKCSLVPRSGTCSTGRVGEEPRVIQLVNNPREVEEPLFFETPSPDPYAESRRNSVINIGPIRLRMRVGTWWIPDGARQDSSEKGNWSWHDEGRPDSVISAVKDEEAPRRRQANMSVYRAVVRKWGILDWSEDAWDPAMVHIRTGSVETTSQRFKGRGARYPCLGHVWGLSRAGRPISVFKHGRRATFRQSGCHGRAAFGRSMQESQLLGLSC